MAGPGTTSRDADARSAVSLYSEPAGSLTGLPAGDRPWGAPDGIEVQAAARRTKVIESTLQHLTQLLDLLQPAHRTGDLSPLDLEDLHRLQAWYSRLQTERERMRIAALTPQP